MPEMVVGNFGLEGRLVDVSQSEGVTGVGDFGIDESTVTRVYDLDNTSLANTTHFQYVQKLLGWPALATGVGGVKYVTRNRPHFIGHYLNPSVVFSDNGAFLWAVKCKLNGRSPKGFVPTTSGVDYPIYNSYRYTVTYETLPWEIKENSTITQSNGVPDESYWQRYISKQAKPTGEYFSLPVSTTTVVGVTPITVYSYKYVTAGTPNVTQSLGKLLSTCNLSVTWHQVPETCVPSCFVNPNLISGADAIENSLGKVNRYLFNNYYPGTLLLLGVQMVPHRSPFGQRIFDVTSLFKFFQPSGIKGHLYSFRPDPTNPDWVEVTTDGTTNLVATPTAGKGIYDQIDFRPLFRPPA